MGYAELHVRTNFSPFCTGRPIRKNMCAVPMTLGMPPLP